MPTEKEKSKTATPHWASIGELGYIMGMRFMFFMYRMLGRWPFRFILYPVLIWYILLYPLPRKASRDYLRRMAPFAPVLTNWRGVWIHYFHFAETILDKLVLWSGKFDTSHVTYFGAEPFFSRLQEKKGGVLLCTHMGNLELSRLLAKTYSDVKMTLLVHTHNAQNFNEMLKRINPESQTDLIQVSELNPATAMQLSDKVARGELIVIAGDRVPVDNPSRTLPISFLQEEAHFPIGPFVIAHVLQCPVYTIFSFKRGKRFELHFELLCEQVQLSRGHREESVKPYLQLFANRIEHYCKIAPYEWFNFYDFWGVNNTMIDIASSAERSSKD